MPPLTVAFVGASSGTWTVERLETVAGSPLAPASHVEVLEGPAAASPDDDPLWVLALAQDERRRILEERSHHVATGIEHLPAIARRLLHGRDLGEPFDFLTWFEFAPADGIGFEELVQRLRATEEWTYVEREIDIRLAR